MARKTLPTDYDNTVDINITRTSIILSNYTGYPKEAEQVVADVICHKLNNSPHMESAPYPLDLTSKDTWRQREAIKQSCKAEIKRLEEEIEQLKVISNLLGKRNYKQL